MPGVWGDTRLVLPTECAGAYRNAYTREMWALEEEVSAERLFARFPVAAAVRPGLNGLLVYRSLPKSGAG